MRYNWKRMRMRMPMWVWLGKRSIESPFGPLATIWPGLSWLFRYSKPSLVFSCIHFLASISDCTPGSRWFHVVHSGHWATSAARVIGHLIRFGTLLIQSMSCHLIRQSWLRSQETLIEINWFPLTCFVSRIRNGLKNDRMKVPSVELLLLLQ